MKNLLNKIFYNWKGLNLTQLVLTVSLGLAHKYGLISLNFQNNSEKTNQEIQLDDSLSSNKVSLNNETNQLIFKTGSDDILILETHNNNKVTAIKNHSFIEKEADLEVLKSVLEIRSGAIDGVEGTDAFGVNPPRLNQPSASKSLTEKIFQEATSINHEDSSSDGSDSNWSDDYTSSFNSQDLNVNQGFMDYIENELSVVSSNDFETCEIPQVPL